MLTTIFVLIAHMRRENFSKGRTRGGIYSKDQGGGKEIKDLSTLYIPAIFRFLILPNLARSSHQASELAAMQCINQLDVTCIGRESHYLSRVCNYIRGHLRHMAIVFMAWWK